MLPTFSRESSLGPHGCPRFPVKVHSPTFSVQSGTRVALYLYLSIYLSLSLYIYIYIYIYLYLFIVYIHIYIYTHTYICFLQGTRLLRAACRTLPPKRRVTLRLNEYRTLNRWTPDITTTKCWQRMFKPTTLRVTTAKPTSNMLVVSSQEFVSV